MTARRSIDGGRRSEAGGVHGHGSLLQLGWSHFWLLSGVLAGMIALVVLVLFAQLSAR
jgi:hypothetical protein